MEIICTNNVKEHEQLDRQLLWMGQYNKSKTGKRICFRTGIHEHDLNNDFLHHTPFKGKGWHADFRTYQYTGDSSERKNVMLDLRSKGYIWESFIHYYDEKEKLNIFRSRPELVIYADNLNRAEAAVRLIPAAITVFTNSFVDVEQHIDRYDGWTLEERRPYLLHEVPENRYSIPEIAQSIKVLAKASHSNKIQYAILRYWASRKLCDVDEMINHHKCFDGSAGITKNPIAHTLFSQAILLAYGAISEFGVDVKVNRRKGDSESYVRNATCMEIGKKLEALKINAETKITWSTTKTKRKIDKQYQLDSLHEIGKAIKKTRTKYITLKEAIYYTGRLRSKLSAHEFSRGTSQLTARDVLNAQNIARYLICHQTKILDQMPFYFF